MEISDLVSPESVIPKLRARSKKQALQELSKRLAPLVHQDEEAIFNVLLEREKLGTTGVGTGKHSTAAIAVDGTDSTGTWSIWRYVSGQGNGPLP